MRCLNAESGGGATRRMCDVTNVPQRTSIYMMWEDEPQSFDVETPGPAGNASTSLRLTTRYFSSFLSLPVREFGLRPSRYYEGGGAVMSKLMSTGTGGNLQVGVFSAAI